jgi:hypothetical protein
MAISESQANDLAQAYQSGSGNLQDLVNQYGVTQADVAQYFPGFDVGAAGLSLPSAQASSPLAQTPDTSSAPVAPVASPSPLNASTSAPSNQLSGVVLAGDSWLANNALNTPYIQNELGSMPVTNVAVGGSTSGDALKQLNNFIGSGGTFAPGTTVVLDAGGNDLLQGIPRDQILKNLTQISQTLGAQGVNVVLSGAPSVNSVKDVTGSSSLGIDPLFQQVADTNPNVTVVDAMSPLLNQKNLVDTSGFHMNNAGQMGYDTTLADAVLKLQGKGPVTFTTSDIAQFAKDNNLTKEQAIALAPSFGVSTDQVVEAFKPTTPFSSPLAPPTVSDASTQFNQTYNALQYGNTKVVQSGQGEDGQPTYAVVDTSGRTLPATPVNVGNGIYDLQIGSAGGIIHAYTNVDANGYLNPIKDYSTQVQYTGGQKGGFVNQTASGLANLASVAAPAAAILSGNPEFANVGNVISGTLAGANTINAINNGNVPGAVLSALGVANALPTGTLPFDTSTLKTASTVASAANAIANKNPLALANAVMSATDTKLPSDVGAGIKLASAYASMQKGDVSGMMNSMMSFAKSQDPKVSNSAQKVVDAVQSGADPKVALDQFTKDVGIPSSIATAIASLSPEALAQAGYGSNVATLASADPNFTPVSSPLSKDANKTTDTTSTTDTTAQDTGGFTGGSAGYYQEQYNNLTNAGISEDLARTIARSLTNDAISKNQAGDTFYFDANGGLHADFGYANRNTPTGNGGQPSENVPVLGDNTGQNGESTSPLANQNNANVLPPVTVVGKRTADENLNQTEPYVLPPVSVSGKKTSDVPQYTLPPVTVTGKKIADEVVPEVLPTIPSSVPSYTLPPVTVTGKKPVDVVTPQVPPTVLPPVTVTAKKPVDETTPVTPTPVTSTPVTSTPLTVPSTTTKTPTTTQATSPSSSSPFKESFLPMVATMLAGAPVYNEKHQLAQLHQLYDSLDPNLARVLQQAGIIPPEPPRETKKSEEPTQAEMDKIMAETKATQPEVAQPFLFADGGSTFNDLVKNTEYRNIAPVAPTMLKEAPVVQQESRLSPLRHLKQGITKTAPSASLLAHGGLSHKYKEAAPEGHDPEFITGLTGYYADGKGTGQSDDIPAMLHEGDYVMDADTVAAFGDGSSKAGAQVMDKLHHTIPHKMAVGGNPVPAKIADGEYVFPASFVTALGGGDNKLGSKLLDSMREELRAHKRSAPDTKIPPKAKSPLEYLKMAKG